MAEIKFKEDVEKELEESEDYRKVVEKDSELKNFVVDYVGNKLKKELDVTVGDIIEVFAEDFPEFLLSVAEENFIRGYSQALADVDIGRVLEEKEMRGKRKTKKGSRHSSWSSSNRICKKCNYPVVVTQPDVQNHPGCDYHWYCSNKQCFNHDPGEHTGDMECPEWTVDMS